MIVLFAILGFVVGFVLGSIAGSVYRDRVLAKMIDKEWKELEKQIKEITSV